MKCLTDKFILLYKLYVNVYSTIYKEKDPSKEYTTS